MVSAAPVTVTASVSRSERVPDFVLSATAPNPVTVTMPPEPAHGRLFVETGVDWPVTWTSGGEGTVLVELSTFDTHSQMSIRAGCAATAAAGALTIPAAVLRAFAGTGEYGFFKVSVTNGAMTVVEGWRMQLDLRSTSTQYLVTFVD